MSFFTNLFSGKLYTRMGNTIVDEDGNLFTKTGDQWIGRGDEIIQRQGTDLMNLKTGMRSNFGDPFTKNEL